MSELLLDHAPIPGPLYWDWRCLVCSRSVDEHGSWWQRRFKYRRAIRAGADQ